MQSRVLAWPRAVKRVIVIALDINLALLSTWLAFSLRLDSYTWPQDLQWWVYAITPVLFIPFFIRFGLYRAIFRYTGQAALFATAKAVLLYGITLFLILIWKAWLGVPRSLGILQPLVFFLLVGASRAFARFWLANLEAQGQAQKILIYGAGTAGVQTAFAMSAAGNFKQIGFVDDDASKVGQSINGVPVFESSEIRKLVTEFGVTDLLLALPSASHSRRSAIIESLRDLPLHVRTLPSMADLASGRVTVQDFRELDIEDLLGRDPVPPNRELLEKNLTNKKVLVTGAGGSIGSELCRQILLERPSQLLLLDHSEFNLYSIHQELQKLAAAQLPGIEIVPLIGSVTDRARLHTLFETHRPHTVLHAAAYKHVPLVEQNPSQGILNNVFGTLNAAQVSQEFGVTSFVLISTDKAVRPPNVMGASKRLAEQILQALAAQPSATTFSMVRFGNVLGSSGSVVPLFRQQIASGGPLTVTHAEVTRYFMTIPEAAQLVLQAGAMAHGGEVFVLDMGQPVKIMDLAKRMIELSGLKLRDSAHPNADIAIEITGLRPGEKLYEELLIGDNPETTSHPRIMKAREDYLGWEKLQIQLQTMREALAAEDVAAMRNCLAACVQGFGISASTQA